MSLLLSTASSSLRVHSLLFCQLRTLWTKTRPIYRPGEGVHFKKKMGESDEPKEEDPLDYDLLDRPSSKGGYSHLSNDVKSMGPNHHSVFMKRPYIYPPIERLWRITSWMVVISFTGICIYMVIYDGSEIYKMDTTVFEGWTKFKKEGSNDKS